MVAGAIGRNAMNKLVVATAAVALCTSSTHGASFAPAAKATNEFGIDLYRKIAAGEKNVCLSPYSISCALAMTLDGADGETRREMPRVLTWIRKSKATHPLPRCKHRWVRSAQKQPDCRGIKAKRRAE